MLNKFFAFASALCFAIALLGAVSAITGVNQAAWVDGGLLSLILALFLPPAP